jgi:hypothetical protein
MKHLKDTWGFSLILALWIVMVLSTISIFLLEYIIPFSKSVKWLDNYTKAYYQSWKWVEESLYFLAHSSLGVGTSKNFGSDQVDFSYSMISSGSIFPEPWKGESDFDANWGTIYSNKPIHIYLPSTISWSNTRIYFRVPNFDFDNTSNEVLESFLSSQDIINWQISSSSDVLNSTSSAGSRFIWNDICSSNGTCSWKNIETVMWMKLDGTLQNFWDFFSNNCTSNFTCTLKFSLINQISWESFWVGWKKIPYLEYRIDFWWTRVPYDKVLIQSSGKSYGFKKDFSFDFPLKLINEAFDFTIFQ